MVCATFATSCWILILISVGMAKNRACGTMIDIFMAQQQYFKIYTVVS